MKPASFIKSALREGLTAVQIDPLCNYDSTKVVMVHVLEDVAEYLLRAGYNASDLFDYIDDVRERLGK